MAIFGHIDAYSSLDGKPVARALPKHTIARGNLPSQSRGALKKKYGLDELKQGQERYDIYCTPCHGLGGYGDGLIIERGFPAPDSFHQKRLREIPDQHIFDVIRKGHGKMYPFSDRIRIDQAWNIVAYVRALQLSQNFNLKDAPTNFRKQILRELQ
jgi:mono/diheme cytochrome c family protein